MLARSDASALQVDFDATLSERAFYIDLLQRTRAAIGDMPLSITALASWCKGDTWLDRLPPGTIDEAVPMLFRMGPLNGPLLKAGASNELRSPVCRSAVGISTDEPTPALEGRRRTYIFSPTSWTRESIARAEVEATRWR